MERKGQDPQMLANVRDVNQLVTIKRFIEYDKRVPTMEKVAKMSKPKLY